MHMIKEHLL